MSVKESTYSNRVISDLCVLLPTYCGSATLKRTLLTLLDQTVLPSRVYIRDDTPPALADERQRIRKIAEEFSDRLNFSFSANGENLGYPRNLAKLIEDSEEEYIFLLAQDDILSRLAIETCLQAMRVFPEAGGVARPYYWFDTDQARPVRLVPTLQVDKPKLISVESKWTDIQLALFSAGQLTGLMYQRSKIDVPFIESVFPAHVAPFAGLLRDYGVVYVPEITVAVSIRDSQTRFLSSIYRESPILAWLAMYRRVFGTESESRVTRLGRKIHMGQNFVGLIQIRVHGSLRWFIRESLIMIYCRPLNLIDPRYILTFLGLFLLPPSISRAITDTYKSKWLSSRLKMIRLSIERPAWWSAERFN